MSKPACKLIVLLLLSLIGLHAPAKADPLALRERASSAMMAGSERLRLRAFGRALEQGALGPSELAFMRRDLEAQGYDITPGRPEITAKRLSLAPVLGWDGNINGGVLQSRITLPNGWVLEADPASRAKAGLVFGGSMAATGRLAWDPGRLIEATFASELAWSPRHRLGRADAMLRLCSRNHLFDWTFLDLCATGARSWRQLDIDNSQLMSAELSRIVDLGPGLHALALRYESASTSGAHQDRIRFGVESVWRGSVTDLALTLGAPVDDATVLRRRIEAGLALDGITLLGQSRSLRFDLWGQEAWGSTFLSTPRHDRVKGIGVSVWVRPDMMVRLGVMSSRSTVDIADYDQITLDLRFGDILR